MKLEKTVIRSWVENYTDNIIEDPKIIEQAAKNMFKELGFEASLQTVITFVFGIMVGTVYQFADLMELDQYETVIELIPLIKRRLDKIEDSMIKSRLF